MAKMRVRPLHRREQSLGKTINASDILTQQVTWAKLVIPTREHRFHPERRWRLDVAWPGRKFAVEVDGGGFVQGRHTRGVGLEKDCEKFAEAALLGWTVIRVTPRLVKNGTALRWVERWMQSYEANSGA